MITAIREVRRSRGLTLEDVARACVPPTTPQSIGRLETGTRTVSVTWLNRIAEAMGVTAAELVTLPDRVNLPVAALLDMTGVRAPRHPTQVAPPMAMPGWIAVNVAGSVGDYRTGDAIWCEPLAPEAFAHALNRDVLVPRTAGRYLFGRLIGRDIGAEGGRLHLLPPGQGNRQQIVADPPWIARAARLVRDL